MNTKLILLSILLITGCVSPAPIPEPDPIIIPTTPDPIKVPEKTEPKPMTFPKLKRKTYGRPLETKKTYTPSAILDMCERQPESEWCK